MDERQYVIVYAMDEGSSPEVLGYYSQDVADALMIEYQRSGMLVQYQPLKGSIKILEPVSVQLALITEMIINPTTSEAYN